MTTSQTAIFIALTALACLLYVWLTLPEPMHAVEGSFVPRDELIRLSEP